MRNVMGDDRGCIRCGDENRNVMGDDRGGTRCGDENIDGGRV